MRDILGRIEKISQAIKAADSCRREVVVKRKNSAFPLARMVASHGGVTVYAEDEQGEPVDYDAARVVGVNDVYFPLLWCDARWLIMYGGAGSGKSKFAAQKMVYRMITERRHSMLCVRKVARSIKESQWRDILWACDMFGVGDLIETRLQPLSLYYPQTGSSVYFVGIDDEEKIKSLHAVTSQWLEEPTAMTQGDVTQLNLRMREATDYPAQILMTFNPISERHWIKKKFFDSPRSSAQFLRTTYRDNLFLPEDYGNQLDELTSFDKIKSQVYRDGQWGQVEGAIYGNWPVVSAPPGVPDEIIYGIDFGYENPAAVVRVEMHDSVPYVAQAMYRSHTTISDIAEAIESDMAACVTPRSGVHLCYADSADPGRIAELNARGTVAVLPAHKSPGSVLAGIDYVRRQSVHVIAPSEDLLREHDMYAMRVLPGGQEAPYKHDDHAMDALRYALYTHHMSHGTDDGDGLCDIGSILRR